MLTNEELIETLISDCNNAVAAVAHGQYIRWCKIMFEMVQKLANLKVGVHNDIKSRDETISVMKQNLIDLGVALEEIQPSENKQT